MTTDPTAALKLARDALAWLHDMAEGHKSIGHLYDGDCPDQLDRTRRDPACPACKALDKAADALAAIDALPAPSGEPAAWTTNAHVDAMRFGKSGLFVKTPGTIFCVPVYFGKPQSIDDFRD